MTTPTTSAEVVDLEAPCARCLAAGGLCRFCSHRILPQLAQPFWYRLVGTVMVEQKKRQTGNKPDPRAARIRARKERKRIDRMIRLTSGQFAPVRCEVAA